MNWKDWITSPPPTTMWIFDEHEVAVVTRDRKGTLNSVSAKCPSGVFEIGPVGLQGLDSEQLAPLMAQLHASAQGKGRPAVVFPTSWVRSHLLEFDHLPRKHAEIDEVLRWRLKKLVPVPPSELRLSWAAFSGEGSSRIMLSTAGIERVFAALLANFKNIGTEPGLMTPLLFAWARALPSLSVPRLLIQFESGYLSMLLVENDIPRLLRTKQMPKNDPERQGAEGEFRLVYKYIRGQLGVEGLLRISVTSSSREFAESLRAWWSGLEGVDLDQEESSWSQPGVEENLGAVRMAAVNSVLAGETP